MRLDFPTVALGSLGSPYLCDGEITEMCDDSSNIDNNDVNNDNNNDDSNNKLRTTTAAVRTSSFCMKPLTERQTDTQIDKRPALQSPFRQT